VKVKKVYKIGQDRYNVEMNNWNEKLMVLKTKGKLRGKEIYIDSALTLTERDRFRKRSETSPRKKELMEPQ
jgi:hypothetical protein